MDYVEEKELTTGFGKMEVISDTEKNNFNDRIGRKLNLVEVRIDSMTIRTVIIMTYNRKSHVYAEYL